eukprot:TRINITY_DN1291_c0_g2_i1.p1 TRINITY_DN1291_c0_g2~~TRINITY_DN1291_c0_g2_i1.p1  ORF type:complete len:283 (-),score=69.83 TRINITY_DN1291_c0_g2_i1:305-1153(-)
MEKNEPESAKEESDRISAGLGRVTAISRGEIQRARNRHREPFPRRRHSNPHTATQHRQSLGQYSQAQHLHSCQRLHQPGVIFTPPFREAYLNARYYKQAFSHLTNALKMNTTLLSKLEETKQYHAHILTLLGRCYMEGGNVDDALELLEKSLEMNKAILGGDDFSNCSIYIIMAHIYLKKAMYDQAVQLLLLVKELSEGRFGKKSETTASVFLELADAYVKKGEYEQAIEYQKEAFEAYKELGSVDQKTLGSIAIKLSEIYDQAEMLEDAIETLRVVTVSST